MYIDVETGAGNEKDINFHDHIGIRNNRHHRN
jgi:hypothetical protein